MHTNHSNTNRVRSITILIHSDKRSFQNVFVTLLSRRCFHGINAMILMPQIFDVTANENAGYKRNELEFIHSLPIILHEIPETDARPVILDHIWVD